MNLVLVKTFLETIAAGNLNRAAERLNVTQSTVTTRLNALEDQLGQVLIVRSKDGTKLTSAGFQFVRHAEILVQTWQQARYELGLPKGFSGVCNLGCEMDLWRGVGEIWLRRMRTEHPQLALSIWTGSLEEIHYWLSAGMIDVGITFEAKSSAHVTVKPLLIMYEAQQGHDLTQWLRIIEP